MMPQTQVPGRHLTLPRPATFVRASFIVAFVLAGLGVPAGAAGSADPGVPVAAGARGSSGTAGEGIAGVDPERLERLGASFVLALGRAPSPAEVEAWSGADQSVADLMERHRKRLRDDLAERQAVTARALRDTFGDPGNVTTVPDVADAPDYVSMMRRHLDHLAGHADEYARILNAVYQLVLARDVYSLEVDYWRKRPVLPFSLLAACVDDWARRNQPGLMVTAGVAAVSVNSGYLVTVRLSPAVAAEARRALGNNRPSPADVAAGRFVVSPGGDALASVGGIHFAAAGGGPQR